MFLYLTCVVALLLRWLEIQFAGLAGIGDAKSPVMVAVAISAILVVQNDVISVFLPYNQPTVLFCNSNSRTSLLRTLVVRCTYVLSGTYYVRMHVATCT